jgi:hypothetical protein
MGCHVDTSFIHATLSSRTSKEYAKPMYSRRTILTLLSIAALARSSGVFADESPAADTITPEQRMNRRFPQKVRVGDLLGLALIDYDNRILGRVKEVVRTRDGKIVLVTTYGSWFGLGGRPVGVPLETVAILGRQIGVLDIDRKDFPTLPTWQGTGATGISPDETIQIAIARR